MFVKPTLRLLHHLQKLKFSNKTLYEAVFSKMESIKRVKVTKTCILKFDPK